MSVWESLVGQAGVVHLLQAALEGADHAMTHAWLFTGPPGSGRSVAALAFAAGLQCVDGGCGNCRECKLVQTGVHPDVLVVRTERLSIGVDEIRELVRRSAMIPAWGRWQVVVIEDADRMTERAANALLRAIEEPAAKTVWILCTPTPDDLIVTIRSRCRHVGLVTPSVKAVTTLLESEGIEADKALFAARVSQGHIGRARAIASDPEVASRRHQILAIPGKLTDLGGCLGAAAWAIKTAQDEAAQITTRLNAEEKQKLMIALGMDQGRTVRGAAGQLKEMEEQQGLRAKRLVRDCLDSILLELTSYYRDILVSQIGAGVDLINPDYGDAIAKEALNTSSESTIMRLDAIAECRKALAANVAPQLGFEALMVSLA